MNMTVICYMFIWRPTFENIFCCTIWNLWLNIYVGRLTVKGDNKICDLISIESVLLAWDEVATKITKLSLSYTRMSLRLLLWLLQQLFSSIHSNNLLVKFHVKCNITTRNTIVKLLLWVGYTSINEIQIIKILKLLQLDDSY